MACVDHRDHTDPVATLRIIVVEDEPLYLDLLVGAVVSRIAGTKVVGSFATAEEALAQAPSLRADVLLTDIDLGSGMSGPALGIEMRRTTSVRGVVLLSNLALPSVLTTLPADVRGGWSYLLKTSVTSVDQLGRAILQAAEGQVLIDDELVMGLVSAPNTPMDSLTPRQFEVLSRMARGSSNRRIAEDLHLTPRTIESVVSDIIENLGVRNDLDADGLNPRVVSVLMYLEHTVLRSRRDLGDGQARRA